jgi:hypothetical protein
MCNFTQNVDWNAALCPEIPGCFTDFNRAVIVLNLFLVACFAVLYRFEIQREAWLMKHLDVERTQLTGNLVHTQFWNVRGHECKILNLRLFRAYCCTLSVFLLNAVASALLVMPTKTDYLESIIKWNGGFGGYWIDYRTATVFISNVSLLLIKLIRGVYLLYCMCLEKTTTVRFCGWDIVQLQPLPPGLSTADFEPTSYNVISPDFCLKELGAPDELVGSWRLRNPNGLSCPQVPRIPSELSCNCSTLTSLEFNSTQRGFVPMLVQAR